MRARVGILMGVMAAAFPASAPAQNVTVAISPTPAPALGRVVAGTATSTYSIDAAVGTVTRLTGNSVRLTSGAVTTPSITIVCKSPCTGGNRTVNISVTAGPVTGRTSISSFGYGSFTSTPAGASTSGSTSGSPLNFSIQFTTGGGDKTATFKLGMTASVAATGSTGNGTFAYTVTATRP